MIKHFIAACACGAMLFACKKDPQSTNTKTQSLTKVKAKKSLASQKLGKPTKVLTADMLAAGAKVTDKTQCKIYMKVSGMVCQHGCAPQVRKTLTGVKGISEALVSYKTKSATIDAIGSICGGKQTQKLVNKAFSKQTTYKCKVSKIELFGKQS